MKLNLRKANALQIAIGQQIAVVEMPVSVNIDRYVSPLDVVEKAQAVFNAGLLKKQELFEVLYIIREKTAAASFRAGVSDLLAKDAHIGKQIALLEPLARVRVYAKTPQQLSAAQLDLIEDKQPVQYAHQRRESFEVGFIHEAATKAWETEVAVLKRRKQTISDALLEANVKNEIELSDLQTEILKKYGLV